MKTIRGECRPVGIWIRVSTEDQARGDSPEHHERRARAYAESQGWIVQEVYRLEGVSGKAVASHPEAKRMLRDVERGHITALVFSKLARLARNTKELLDFADRFRAVGADLVSLQEAIDTSTPAGRLFFTIIAAMAEWERSEIVDRIRASITVRAQMGKTLGGAAPFGYQWKDKRLVADPQEAPIRRRMYELFDEHKRKKTVARLLNDAGYRTRKGAEFADSTVVRLIQDTTAKGQYRANHTFRDGNGKLRFKPETEWHFSPCEAIVPEDLWRRCNDLLRAEIRKAPLGPPTVHLFAGLLYCGCGAKMYVFSRSPKYICPKCRTKIPMDDLESIFRDELRAFSISEDTVRSHLEAANLNLQAHQERLAAHSKDLEKVRSEMAKVYRLHMDGHLASEAFGKLYRPLEERERALAEELPKLEGEIDALRVKDLSAAEVVSEAASLYAAWPKLTPAEKRKVIESVTERIVLSGSEVSITLCALPSSEELTKRQRNVWGSWPQPA
jgi:site-specific DNA recombinase